MTVRSFALAVAVSLAIAAAATASPAPRATLSGVAGVSQPDQAGPHHKKHRHGKHHKKAHGNKKGDVPAA